MPLIGAPTHREWNWFDEWSWTKTLRLPFDDDKWTKSANNPVLSPTGGVGDFDKERVSYPSVVYKDGVYYLFYQGDEDTYPPYEYIGIGLATSTSFDSGFSRHGNNPLIEPSDLGTGWTMESGMCVIYDEIETDSAKKWKMWVAAEDAGGTDKLVYFYATNPEGPWTRGGTCTGIARVCGNNVLRLGNTFFLAGDILSPVHLVMFTSSDGLAWTERGTILNLGAAGEWDYNSLRFICLFFNMGILYVAYAGHDGAIWAIGLAMNSLDKIVSEYTKFYANPILERGAGGQWDDDYIFPNSLMAFEGKFYLYYGAGDGANHRIGVATVP